MLPPDELQLVVISGVDDDGETVYLNREGLKTTRDLRFAMYFKTEENAEQYYKDFVTASSLIGNLPLQKLTQVLRIVYSLKTFYMHLVKNYK